MAIDLGLVLDARRSRRSHHRRLRGSDVALAIASGANPGTDRANLRTDAVRTGLAAGAGAGAAVGLMLAFRRQYHQEVVTELTDRDATERRITELYTKAVEQFGSDKAPVRLGGLYALERLAQDDPAQRQTIVIVICAYLRMRGRYATPANLRAVSRVIGTDSGRADSAIGASVAVLRPANPLTVRDDHGGLLNGASGQIRRAAHSRHAFV